MVVSIRKISDEPAITDALEAVRGEDFRALAKAVENVKSLVESGRAEFSHSLFSAAKFLALDPAHAEIAMRAIVTAAIYNDGLLKGAVHLVLDKLKYHSDPAKRVNAATLIAEKCPNQSLRETAKEMLSKEYMPAWEKERYWGRGRKSLGDPAPLIP